MTAMSLGNVTAVLPDRLIEHALVTCEDGLIVEVEDRSGRGLPSGAIDGGGALLLPGLIDVHSDALEREISPRPGATFPLDFAIYSFEARLRAAGVLTVFNGLGFQDNENFGRSVSRATAHSEELAARRDADPAVSHRVLHRLDVRDPAGADGIVACLRTDIPEGEVSLVSLEDHTPGQGQFRDLASIRRYYRETTQRPPEEIEAMIAAHIAERDTLLVHVGENRRRMTELAQQGRIRLLGHDLTDAQEVRAARELGVAVAEFPLTLDAAEQARELEMPVVMGAPNVVRQGSHSGNVAAEEVIARGWCDALASDYQPTTLLGSVSALIERGVLTLPAAIALVTAGPARVAGLTDRGVIAPGMRADLVLTVPDGRWPRVRATIRAEELRADAPHGAPPLSLALQRS